MASKIEYNAEPTIGRVLETVRSPDDVKQLKIPELKALAEDVRQFILDSVSRTGGHLASNLGAVELTIALHYVFDFKVDRLVWDVGHQCYAHKILTGRKDGFTRLRQAGGVSGFPNPSESPYDPFMVGHAGTSICTAVGLALGEQIKRSQTPAVAGPGPRVVAFVGDASIVNGNSFEGLNNLGLVKRQMLIVLNDNSMAIDATVGSLAKYLAKARLSHTYEDIRRRTSSLLEHVPGIGRSMEDAVERFKKHIRMVLPGSQLFESLNIPYFGPVDGHDIESLVQLFSALGSLDHPVILHAYTTKGKGFAPADEGPARFHSTGPFKINGDDVEYSGSPGISGHSEPLSFTEVFGQSIVDLAEKDDRIVAITSAMCDGTGLNEFRERFPKRFYDVGIAESAAVDIAAGMAHAGLRPVVCIYSTFLQRSFDQIFQEVALQDLPVIFCVDRAGLVGADGPTHHGVMDIGFLRMMPNMVVAAPANGPEMGLALDFAVRHGHPVVIRYPKDFVPTNGFVRAATQRPFELGKSVVVKNVVRAEVVIVSYGAMLTEALKAERVLSKEGIAVGVMNARFAAPVDERISALVEKGKKLITVEDHGLACGFGSAVLEMLALAGSRSDGPGAVCVLGAPRVLIGQHSRSQQLIQAGTNADEIVKAARQMVQT